MTLEQKDFEALERIVYKNADDIAVSISRSFERLEERIDAVESRLQSRLSELDDRLESVRQENADLIGEVKEEVRDTVRVDDVE